MPRTAMILGTHGKIRFQRTPGGGAWRARTQFRDFDGVVRPVERVATTKPKAEAKLKEALVDRVRRDEAEDIRPTTRVQALVEAWYTELAFEQQTSATTLDQYRKILDRFTIPMLGQVYASELTPSLLERHHKQVVRKHGAAVAKLNRTVMSGFCGLAVRRGALRGPNPVRELSSTRSEPKKPPQSLEVAAARQLMAYMSYDDQAIARDLPDIVAMMLATSVRIGECLAFRWSLIDPWTPAP